MPSHWLAPHAACMLLLAAAPRWRRVGSRRGLFRWFGGDDLVLERGGREAGAEDEWIDERLLLDGRHGVALSYLRPAGIADIDGHRVDVVTEGEYIAAGDRIEVLRDDGYRRVVRRVPDDPDRSPA